MKRLPQTSFATLANSLNRLVERDAVSEIRRKLLLSDSQMSYIVQSIKDVSRALNEMSAHEAVIRALVEDEDLTEEGENDCQR